MGRYSEQNIIGKMIIGEITEEPEQRNMRIFSQFLNILEIYKLSKNLSQ